MKLLLASRHVAEIGLLKGLLESENIPCFTRNEHLSTISLALEFEPELHVVNDSDFLRAQAILDEYRNGTTELFTLELSKLRRNQRGAIRRLLEL
jgi:hypothetical protein